MVQNEKKWKPWIRFPHSLGVTIAELALAYAVWSIPLAAAAPSGDYTRLMNTGKAALENRNSGKATEAFNAAVQLQPKSAPALRNLARARMLANENEEALRILGRARDSETGSAATIYLMALARAHQARFEEALPLLEEAVRLDPGSPVLRFQLANAYQVTKQPEKALLHLKETLRLDPLHAAAHFKLAGLAAQAEDPVEAQKHTREFMRLRTLFPDETRTPAMLERCAYSLPEPPPPPKDRRSPPIAVRFAEASVEVFPDESTRSATAAAVLEVDAEGACHVFVVDGQGRTGLLALDRAGRLALTPATPTLAGNSPFQQCVAGDFFDDVPKGARYEPALHALNDILLVGSNRLCLLKRTGTNTFEDVTEKAGLSGARARRACWVDYDHDGDLDLALATDAGVELWQNNGDGRFVNVTKAAGLVGAVLAADVAAADFDNNLAIDLVVGQDEQPTLLFMNQRAGRFAPTPDPPGPWPPARRVLTDDLDNDGNPDAVLIGGKEAVIIFGKGGRRQSLDLSPIVPAAAALVDFDNDGWLDICIGGSQRGAQEKGAISLWRNNGDGTFTDVTGPTGLASLSLPPVREIIAADLDNDGDSDLLLVTATGRLHFLRNEGGNAHRQLKLRLIGLKTNPDGFGTRLEVRAGEFWAARTVSRLPIEIGLGGKNELDSVLTVWGNGVVDSQIDVTPKAAPLVVVEKNVAAGSCPYLYAWDGRRFGFVTDLLGNSPLGLLVRRDQLMPSNPEEIVLLGQAKDLRPRRGCYEVEITEELREMLYLDTVRLIAVDHRPDLEVHSTDKLGPPPFPPSELWVLGGSRPLRSAVGDDGIDRTDAVRALDGVFAPPGLPLPPPLRGLTHPLALTLDFGPLDVTSALVLALTGWLQYGDASVNIASSQNESVATIPPRLEVETADGAWIPVPVVVGMPAGKTKTILCDLSGRLPPGARRLRLTTTFELRWDRLALFERHAVTEMEQHEMPPVGARLYWRGFSDIRARAPGHPQTPAFGLVRERPPWRTTPQGWCTRYGEVLELVKARDEQLVLLNAGDALNLRFKARDLPPVRKGWERTFFLYCAGWDKDADPNVVGGDAVEPLPVGADQDWCMEYNTRWVPGNRFAK